MRLLNVKTRRLEEFHGTEIPPYAILSHTWGQDEVTFQGLSREDHTQQRGYNKIKGCCQAAAEQHISYIWVDSCCIDKSSSAELSEAINSMFNWYKASKVCYIYLEDVPTGLDPFPPKSAFRTSRWWTRGWTLQELLAPQHVIFFDSTWERVFPPDMGHYLFTKVILPVRSEDVVERREEHLGDQRPLITAQIRYRLITEITGIPAAVLVKELPLSKVSAACKFSWASQRMTTRIEDKAYCLMGLLGVNMPLLYGEGDRAFVRLQEAVISTSDDISLLAWGYGLGWEAIEELGYDKVLARSPTAFSRYPKSYYQHRRRPPKTHSTVTGHGLHIELPLRLVNARHRVWIGIVEESSDDGFGDGLIALVLKQKSVQDTYTFERARGCPLLRISHFHSSNRLFQGAVSKMVYLQDGGTAPTSTALTDPLALSLLLRACSSSMGKSIDRNKCMTELQICIQGFRTIGYTLSSQYPPIDHDMVSMFAGAVDKWEFSGGKIKSQRESPFEYLLCQGAGNEQYYFILTNKAGHSVAIKVQLRYKPPYIDWYKVSLSHCDSRWNTTALEYACATGFGKHTLQQLQRRMQWDSCIDVWSPNNTKVHVSACPSQQHFSKKRVRYAQCGLVWSGGWVSEGDESVEPKAFK